MLENATTEKKAPSLPSAPSTVPSVEENTKVDSDGDWDLELEAEAAAKAKEKPREYEHYSSHSGDYESDRYELIYILLLNPL